MREKNLRDRLRRSADRQNRLRSVTGSLILCAAVVFLTGCVGPQPFVRDPALLRDCEDPVLAGPTLHDIRELSMRQAYSIAECTQRLRVLREQQPR